MSRELIVLPLSERVVLCAEPLRAISRLPALLEVEPRELIEAETFPFVASSLSVFVPVALALSLSMLALFAVRFVVLSAPLRLRLLRAIEVPAMVLEAVALALMIAFPLLLNPLLSVRVVSVPPRSIARDWLAPTLIAPAIVVLVSEERSRVLLLVVPSSTTFARVIVFPPPFAPLIAILEVPLPLNPAVRLSPLRAVIVRVESLAIKVPAFVFTSTLAKVLVPPLI